MIDGPTKAAIEEAVRFLKPGQIYNPVIDTHELLIVRLFSSRFLIVCATCKGFLGGDVARAYPPIHKHITENNFNAPAPNTILVPPPKGRV